MKIAREFCAGTIKTNSMEITENFYSETINADSNMGFYQLFDSACEEFLRQLQLTHNNIKIVQILFEWILDFLYSNLLPDEIDLRYEPYLKNFVIFMAVTDVYRSRNDKGYTYSEFIYKTFKAYLWPEYASLSYEELTKKYKDSKSHDYQQEETINDIKTFSERIRHRRNKNTNDNISVKLEHENYKGKFPFGSQRGVPGTVKKSIGTDKITEMELVTILAHCSQEDQDIFFSGIMDLAKDRCINTSFHPLDVDFLKKIRSTYRKIEMRHSVSSEEFDVLGRFMYEYLYQNSSLKWLDIYTLEKHMHYKGVREVEKLLARLRLFAGLDDIIEKDIINSTLAMPTRNLQQKFITNFEADLELKGEINSRDLNKSRDEIIQRVKFKVILLHSSLDVLMQNIKDNFSEKIYRKCLNVLINLIDEYAEKYPYATIGESGICNEDIFEIIYKNIYPPKEKQKRNRQGNNS